MNSITNVLLVAESTSGIYKVVCFISAKFALTRAVFSASWRKLSSRGRFVRSSSPSQLNSNSGNTRLTHASATVVVAILNKFVNRRPRRPGDGLLNICPFLQSRMLQKKSRRVSSVGLHGAYLNFDGNVTTRFAVDGRMNLSQGCHPYGLPRELGKEVTNSLPRLNL